MQLRPLARTRPSVDFSRSQVASELGQALDLLVLELDDEDIRRIATDYRTSIVQLRFLRQCANNLATLRRMIRRRRKEANGAD
jgi:hypothetical protein